MSKQQEMIEQLKSKSHARCLEAIDALYGVQSDEILTILLRIMVSDESTFWTNLEKDRHPKVEAYKAALEIATSEALLLALVDRKFPEVRSGAAYLLGKVATADNAEAIQSL